MTHQLELPTEIYSPMLLWSNYSLESCPSVDLQNRQNIRALLSKMYAAATPQKESFAPVQTWQEEPQIVTARQGVNRNKLSENRQRIPVKSVQSGDVVLLRGADEDEQTVGIVLANTGGELIVHSKRASVWRANTLVSLLTDKQVLSAYKLLN